MSEEQATSNKEKENIGPVEAYNILLQRQMSEDRIIVERTNIFLAASSFLYLAFVMLLNPDLAPTFKVLRILLPIVGIFLTISLCRFNLSAGNALRFWHRAEHKIEETPEFAYMLKNDIMPHLHGSEATRGEKVLQRTTEGEWLFQPTEESRMRLGKLLQWLGVNRIYWLYLPGVFGVLWLVSLIVAIIN